MTLEPPTLQPRAPGQPTFAPSRSADAMRRAGIVLIIGGIVAQPALRRMVRWRARIGERRAALVLRLDRPDIATELVGSALVIAAERHEQRRRGGFTPARRRATPAG